MPSKQKRLSMGEVLSQLSTGLRTNALRPNLHGYKPHEKQVEFHASNKAKRMFLGGNRSGKTVGGAVEACWWLTGKHPYRKTPEPPVWGRCVSVDFKDGVEKIVKPEIARWIPQSELKGGTWSNAYDKNLRVLHLENGSFLEFMSYEQDIEKFAGTSRDFIWFDEEPPYDIYVENLLRLADKGGHLWITMTPVEGLTWTFDEIYEKRLTDPTVGVVVVDMTDNPHLNMGEIEEMIDGLSQDEKEARMHGRYVQLGGLIYKNFDEKNIIDPIDTSKLTNWLWVAALDHGFNNPTAWLWAVISPDGQIIVVDEHYESGEIVAYHAERVHQINANHRRVPDYYVGDPSIRNVDPITGTSILIEYTDMGIPIILGNNDVGAGINRVARYLGQSEDKGQPRLLITRNCQNLIWEMQRYRWARWATKKMNFDKNKKEEPHKKNDHACDALRYLISSRPEVDNGVSSPYPVDRSGAAMSVDPAAPLLDYSSRSNNQQEQTDPHMGSYF